MAYMERLGLWGPGTSFQSFGAFSEAISNGGTGAMELVALDMKRRGMCAATAVLASQAAHVVLAPGARMPPHDCCTPQSAHTASTSNAGSSSNDACVD